MNRFYLLGDMLLFFVKSGAILGQLLALNNIHERSVNRYRQLTLF